MGYLGGVAGLEQLEGGYVRAPEVGAGLIGGGSQDEVCPVQEGHFGLVWVQCRGGIAWVESRRG